MVVGMITIGTCYGDADIPVELLGKGPRPGTAWVKALGGLEPFTKISHGGPYQDDTLVVPLPFVRDVHLEKDSDEGPGEEEAIKPNIPAPDWFLESAYEDRTYRE
ncbi:MAG: hypothetical protein PHQ40_18945 [Anaerolineaceae bacterium]|nr:hypothetical protein [Anaerolineaceae bacterium]